MSDLVEPLPGVTLAKQRHIFVGYALYLLWPLQTFFAQVFTPTEAEAEEGEATIWFGTEPGELATPEAAIAIVAPYAIIPDDLSDRLQAEMQATVGIKDGEHQQAAKRRIFGSIH